MEVSHVFTEIKAQIANLEQFHMVCIHILAQEELHLRHEYCQRFSIESSNYGHHKWIQHLENIINAHNAYKETKIFLREQYFNRVINEEVCM